MPFSPEIVNAMLAAIAGLLEETTTSPTLKVPLLSTSFTIRKLLTSPLVAVPVGLLMVMPVKFMEELPAGAIRNPKTTLSVKPSQILLAAGVPVLLIADCASMVFTGPVTVPETVTLAVTSVELAISPLKVALILGLAAT